MQDDRVLACTSCGTRFWAGDSVSAGAPDLCPGCRLILPSAGRQRGVIKFYSTRKKWGFITQPDGHEVFFHRSAWSSEGEPAPQEGDLVEYAVESTDRGPQAIGLRHLDLL